MATRRVTLSYDDEKHVTVHLGLINHAEDSDSAYLRKCVEFFEMNKGEITHQQTVLDRLQRIENILKSGAVVGRDEQAVELRGGEILDDLLEQME
jgi:hypothetical protein